MVEAVFARGTTPIHYYEIPYYQNDIEKISVAYRQKGKNIVIKREDECEMVKNCIHVRLTQEDTFLFREGLAQVQVRIKLTTGEVLRSQEHIIEVLDSSDEEVL